MKLYRPSLLFLILICLYPDLTHALFTGEYATFESLYKESSSVNWLIVGTIAVIAGAALFATGGTASPVVMGIGYWIGGLKGLSGAAAANWGLALLGGGSVASGGFGILGGTALLSASLTFGTELVFDYTLSKAVIEYQYNNLLEHSEKMPTLPPPVNSSGSDAYGDAIEILQGIDKKLPMSANSNQRLVAQAISRIETDEESLSENEKIKHKSLLSLLYFMSNGYKEAKDHAQTAIEYARDSKIKRTLPAFIYATSSLYEPEFDFSHITHDYFRYSILAEPDNPLIPLLFSIYLDRMLLRFHDDLLDETALHQIFTIMESPELEELRMQNYTILLSRYFMRLKLEQQTITALAGTQNNTIKNSPKTLQVVNDSLKNYKDLLGGAETVMSGLLKLDFDDDASRDQRVKFHSLLLDYTKDEARLDCTISLAGYFLRLELEQQKITSLAGTSDKKIENDPGTLQVVSDSLDQYKALLSGANDVMRRLLSLDLDGDGRDQKANLRNSLSDYTKDEARLASLVANLRTRVMETGASATETRSSAREIVAAGIGLAILAILGMFVWRLTRP